MSPAASKLQTIKRFSVCLLVAQVFDIVTTYIFMSMGGQEGNPIMAAVLVNKEAFVIMCLVKVCVVLLLCYSIHVRFLQYKLKETLETVPRNIDLSKKEKAYGFTIIALVATYWTIIGWNFAGIYFLYT
jgi:hypothetical protein